MAKQNLPELGEIYFLSLPSVLVDRAKTHQESLELTKHLSPRITNREIKDLVRIRKLPKNDLDTVSEWFFGGGGISLGLALLGLTIFIVSPFLFTLAGIGLVGSRVIKKMAYWRYRQHALPPLEEETYNQLSDPLNLYAADLSEAINHANAQFELWNHRLAGIRAGILISTKEDEEKYLQLLDLREYLRRRVLHLQHVHDLEKIRQNSLLL